MNSYLGFGLGLLALLVTGQETEIKGARVTVIAKKTAVMQVTVENRRESLLVAWEIGLTEPGASFARLVTGSDFSGRTNDPLEAARAIKPHERRTIEVPLTGLADGASAALRLAFYADGSYEGTPAAVEPWLKHRQERIDDLRYWSRAFEFMPRISEPDLRAYLASQIANRVSLRDDPSGIRVRILNALRQYPSGPDVWPALDGIRGQTERDLAELSRQPAMPAPQAAGAETSAVVVSQVRTASETYAATIENLRDVPIEAYGVERLDTGSGHFGAGMTTDLCVSEPDPTKSGYRRIRPHETQETLLDIRPDPTGALPRARLSFVIFDDLVAEGSGPARDRIFHEREARADDFAYALTALNQATARPPTEVYGFLVEKRVERAKQLQAAGAQETSMAIDELIRQAKESPDRMMAHAAVMKQDWEQVRARLVRHIAR